MECKYCKCVMWPNRYVPTIYDCYKCYAQYNTITMDWKGGATIPGTSPWASVDIKNKVITFTTDDPSTNYHTHEWVDVGFSHSRWVCKSCNIDQPKQ